MDGLKELLMRYSNLCSSCVVLGGSVQVRDFCSCHVEQVVFRLPVNVIESHTDDYVFQEYVLL